MEGLVTVQTKRDTKSKSGKNSSNKNNQPIMNFLVRFVFHPLKGGLQGFAIILGVILISDLVGYLLGMDKTFSIDLNDLLLSTVGFVCFFLIYLIKNFRHH